MAKSSIVKILPSNKGIGVFFHTGIKFFLKSSCPVVGSIIGVLLKLFAISCTYAGTSCSSIAPTFILKTSLEYDCCWIEFYNKTAIKKAIDEYPELRAFIQRKFSNEESFFSHIQHANESVFTTFDRNDFLLGLIFGYGRGNAEYYCRRLEVGTCLKKLPFFRLFRNNLRPHICGGVLEFFFLDDHYENPKKVLLEKDLDALEIEWSWIEDVSWDLRRLCRPVPPYYLSLPFYISRYGSDSEDIRNRYLKARDCLATLLYKRKFKDVITTLANLSQKNSL